MPSFIRVGLSAAFLMCAGAAHAADYPTKPINLVVPYGAGSTTDALARLISTKASDLLGKPIVVQNRAGAGGIIGTEYVARASNDGYTLIFAANQTHATNASLYPKLSYDPVADFTPIARLVMQPQVLVVNAQVPAKSVAELAALARTKSDGLSFGSTGIGTGAHLSGELFALSTQSTMVHVPYNGSEAITALLSGTVDFMFYPYLPLKGHIDQGTLRILASTSPQRVPWLPEVPTMVELGYADFVMSSWFAVYGPKGMADEQVKIIAAAYEKAMQDEEIAKKLAAGGSLNIFGGPEELRKFTASEIERAASVVKRSGVTMQ
ncbi:MAG TPA: tripartite tricarboxylate transporter substrate binding protein [Xanthobacteraceae bacterium]|nr:tripartite tricarboxylate transporter substrate binding protein [Xanthobacteraceae bacterium]